MFGESFGNYSEPIAPKRPQEAVQQSQVIEVPQVQEQQVNNSEVKRLSEQAGVALEASFLFKSDTIIYQEMKNYVLEAVYTSDIETLTHINNQLSGEQGFMLSYMRQFAQVGVDDIPVLELQNQMRMAFLEKTLYSRERTDTPNQAEQFKIASISFNLV